MYEVVIVGAGPAGMTAAIYCARKMAKTLLISSSLGGQASLSNAVENYLGFTLIKGTELVEKFDHHLSAFDQTLTEKIITGEVYKISKTKNPKYPWKIFYSDGDRIYSAETQTIIIAAGKVPKELSVPGEKEFIHRGVTYCAWCDGPYFKNKEIVIVGGGNSALDAILNIAPSVKMINVINNAESLNGDQIMINKVNSLKNVKVFNNHQVLEIFGSRLVEGIKIKDLHNKKESDLATQGVFLEIGYSPATTWLRNLIHLNKHQEIVIDKHNATNQPGIFAAGDITDVIEKQIVVAAGEGAKAAIQACKYLARF